MRWVISHRSIPSHGISAVVCAAVGDAVSRRAAHPDRGGGNRHRCDRIISGELPALSEWKRPLLGFKSPAARWALLTGLLISIYSAIDKVGVRYVDPLPYLYLFLVVAWLALFQCSGSIPIGVRRCARSWGRYAESRAARRRRGVVGRGCVWFGVGRAELESSESRKSGTRIERGDRRVDWRAFPGRAGRPVGSWLPR